MNYLPNAFAFIYVIDVSRAGGVEEDFRQRVRRSIYVAKKKQDNVLYWRKLEEPGGTDRLYNL